MKIVLSGLPATGKTTLGATLATAFNAPFVHEAAADLASLGANVGPAMTFETLSSIMLVQMARESEHTGAFVADRGSLDMLAYARMLRRHATDDASSLIFSAIETLAYDWLECAHYDLIVYHDTLCGPRGAELQRRRAAYLQQLAGCFEAIISEQKLVVLRMPGDLTVAARCDVITAALARSK